MFHRSKIVCTLVLAILSSLNLIYAVEHGFMIDAGSTGTRLHLYQWDARSISEETGWRLPETYPISQDGWSIKVNIPLAQKDMAKVAELIEQIHEAGKTMLKNVNVHESQYKNVPIYLGATAGMRVLAPNERDEIMRETRRLLKDGPFKFDDIMNARIISGEEEGVFGLIAVNYLKGTFQKDGGVAADELYGALDLGGASTQITFGTTNTLLEGAWDILGPNHKRYYAYTHSYLYYGLEHWRFRINNLVAETGNPLVKSDLYQVKDAPLTAKADVYEHPCLNAGYKEEYKTVVETLDGPTTSRSVEFQGTSNPEQCYELTKQLIKPFNRKNNVKQQNVGDGESKGCWSKECAFSDVYMPEIPTNMKFVAFSAFPSILRDLDMLSNSARTSETYDAPKSTDFNSQSSSGGNTNVKPGVLRSLALETVCKLSYDELRQMYPNAKYLETACTSLTYAYALLIDGYGFDPESEQIYFLAEETIPSLSQSSSIAETNRERFTPTALRRMSQNHVGATETQTKSKEQDNKVVEITWTLGRMIYETNLLPYMVDTTSSNNVYIQRYNSLHKKYTKYVHAVVILSVILGLICIGLFLYYLISVRQQCNDQKHIQLDSDTFADTQQTYSNLDSDSTL